MLICPKCKAVEWRAMVTQSVDITLDNGFELADNGFDFSDPEIDKKSVYCNNCGFEPQQHGD